MTRRWFLQRVRRPEVVVGHDEFGRVNPLGRDAVGAQHGGQQRRSQPFTQTGDHIQTARRQFAQHIDAAAKTFEA
ncbi:MAG: hypothetical protein KDH08_05180, partial [Anaerolineae bacterium]|nr:hypothetical protein [Anaerolineae bacterium]